MNGRPAGLRLGLVAAFFMVLVSAFLGCGQSQPAMAGMYVDHSVGDLSEARDTLLLEKASGNRYLLHRRTGYRLREAGGGFGDWKWEKEEWSAVWEDSFKGLLESRNGKVITLDEETGELLVGRRRYERVKK